jgi:hypothetical protein
MHPATINHSRDVIEQAPQARTMQPRRLAHALIL